MDDSKCSSLAKYSTKTHVNDRHPFVKENAVFARELSFMQKHTFKAELESVYCHGIEYFSKEYLRNKIIEHYRDCPLC